MSDSTYNSEASNEDFEFKALEHAYNYRLSLIREFSKYLKGSVIEIGSGIGQMTALFRELKDISFLQCTEPDQRFSSKLREKFPDQPIFEGIARDIYKKDWDAIVTINVLEHIEKDQEELRVYFDLLKEKRGSLCLFVPARPEIYAPLDKDFGHYRRYTKKNLTEKLAHAGFIVESIRYYNMVGYFAWWFSFCFLKQRSFNAKAVIFYDKVIFPIVYFVESRIAHPPFGQSLIVVAKAVSDK
ncbi:MAG: class I SAM-dependent methyltransferase [Patescibacteria group bacterium]